jgi:hypothetical protein
MLSTPLVVGRRSGSLRVSSLPGSPLAAVRLAAARLVYLFGDIGLFSAAIIGLFLGEIGLSRSLIRLRASRESVVQVSDQHR